ncbi:MAG: hypothetical protein JKY37_34230 [Nannocystaceae bacterium]|nr:hypothetical protein [Nannocystaceae bacterium]
MTTLSRSRPETCLSDLALDKLIVGELDGAAHASAREHLEGCTVCRSRYEEIDGFDAELPSLVLPQTGRGSWRAGIVTLVAAAAVLAVVLWPKGDLPVDRVEEPPVDDGGPGTRTKGDGVAMEWFVRRGAAVIPGDTLTALQPGDVLGFTYSAIEPRFVAVFGRDGAGTVTDYFPDGPAATRMEPGRELPFGRGIELDDTLGDEAVYGIFCRRPALVSELRAAVDAARDEPEPPQGCRVITLRATKRAVP